MAKKKSSGIKYFSWFCPGCKMNHGANCDPDNYGAWTYENENGKITIKPSLLIRYENQSGEKTICHSDITDGMVEYKSDTTHEFKGMKIQLQKPR